MNSSHSMEIELTVVDLDLVESSESSYTIHRELGPRGTELLYEEIEGFVIKALQSVDPNSIASVEDGGFPIMSLGGDGYRIPFKDVNDAYDFVIKFSEKVNSHNRKSDRKKRTFRISAVTGEVSYNKSKLGLDIIRGDILRKLNRLLVGAPPGWFYIDKKTFNLLPENKQEIFSQTTSVKGKSHETSEKIGAWRHRVISNISTPEDPQPFEFQIVTVNDRGEVINSGKSQALSFVESLAEELEIEMVKIPRETFTMGSRENEAGHHRSESPQHQVTVPSFFMGKYPVTQAQWRFVAHLPKVNRDLKPEPSLFKGENLPVEQVSWSNVGEFCKRLSRHTGRKYRLPSEAEWEYACRAGTTTPFYFGETITTKLANYDPRERFAKEADRVRVEFRTKTTVVGQFPPNAFGLHDMHGNVWELCIDNRHDNYEGAPNDGSAWIKNGNDNNCSVMRGGSYLTLPNECRSASRYPKFEGVVGRDYCNNDVGFRLVCGVGAFK